MVHPAKMQVLDWSVVALSLNGKLYALKYFWAAVRSAFGATKSDLAASIEKAMGVW
jgi:hypothetical protein